MICSLKLEGRGVSHVILDDIVVIRKIIGLA
jgi:hypothetical protein